MQAVHLNSVPHVSQAVPEIRSNADLSRSNMNGVSAIGVSDSEDDPFNSSNSNREASNESDRVSYDEGLAQWTFERDRQDQTGWVRDGFVQPNPQVNAHLAFA